MRIKYILLLVTLGFLVLQACNSVSENTVTISGNFTNLRETKLYIYQLLPAGRPIIDSVNTDAEGKFAVFFDVAKSGYYTLALNPSDMITLVISPGEKIFLSANGSNLNKNYTVEGSTDSKLFSEYNQFTNDNLLKVDSLSRVFANSQASANYQSVKKQLDAAYMQIFNDQQEKVSSFVNANASSLASLLVISENFGPNPLLSEKTHPALFLKLDSALMLAYPENSLVNSFHLRMLSFKAELSDIRAHDSLLKPGMPVPEIALPDASEKEIRLSAFKGKLTLIYFWSSWNALSRQTNMNLSTLYTSYHSRGFEIYAVSVDSDADLWKKACLIDRAYWTNVIDIKGLASEFSKTYGVRALPYLILVSKEGNVISRQMDFVQLEDLIKRNL